ncbi:MAG TPA: hypothetical protein ENK48_07080 [Gammaproteobacteria bacterium]|nr:hypothetical protein [Gammaproteobacteria bacterium]
MVRRGALMLACLLAPLTAWGATLQAYVDRKQLYVGEAILFILTLTDSDTRLRAQGLDPNVDLSVLTRDFDVGVPQASHRYNIYRNRGRSTSEIRVALFPRHAGDLRIPAFTVEGASSSPIRLHVMPAPPDPRPEVFLRSGLSTNPRWQGERGIAYLDLYRRVDLKEARLGGDLDTEPKRLLLSALPASERKAQVEGLEYQVTRTAWSLTPTEAGEVKIHFPDVWITTAKGRRIRLPFSDASLSVRPLPPGTPAGILVGRPRLTRTMPSQAPRARQPFSWQITLRAPVDIQALPDQLPLEDNGDFKLYAELPRRRWLTSDADTPLAEASYTLYATPLRAGRLMLPGLSLPYFDPHTGRTAEATLPPVPLTVSAAPSSRATPPPAAPQESRPAPESDADPGWWQLATAVFAALWLATLLLRPWRLRHRRPATPAGRESPPGSGRPPMVNRLAQVLGTASLEEGLRLWEKSHGPDPDLRTLVREIQAFHYAPGAARDEAGLQQALRRFLRRAGLPPDSASPTGPDPWDPASFARPPAPSPGKADNHPENDSPVPGRKKV